MRSWVSYFEIGTKSFAVENVTLKVNTFECKSMWTRQVNSASQVRLKTRHIWRRTHLTRLQLCAHVYVFELLSLERLVYCTSRKKTKRTCSAERRKHKRAKCMCNMTLKMLVDDGWACRRVECTLDAITQVTTVVSSWSEKCLKTAWS